MPEIVFLVADYDGRGTPLVTPDLSTAWQYLLEGKQVFTGRAAVGDPTVLGDWRQLYIAADESAVPALKLVRK